MPWSAAVLAGAYLSKRLFWQGEIMLFYELKL